MLAAARTAVAEACHRLAAEGLVVGTAGNVSVREGDRVAVTATGLVLAAATPGQVTVVDLAGRVLAGDLVPTSEIELHLAIYRRYRSGAVVHTHSPRATAAACVLDELPCVHYAMLLFGGAVRTAPYATFGTPELASNVVAALDGKGAALMANHGAVTHAADLATAVEMAVTLEWACTVHAHAVVLGTPRVLDEQQQQAVRATVAARRYGTVRPITPVDPR